jgi:hypothetical protein
MAGKRFLITVLTIGLLGIVAGGCSDDSPVSLTDTAPPAVPTDVTAVYASSDGYVELNWAENTVDADYAGVRISRIYAGQTTVLTDAVYTESSYRDYNGLPGTNVYEVSAVDQNGNQSAAAAVSVDLPVSGSKLDLDLD